MQKKREAAAIAAAPDDDCGLTHFYAAAKLPSGGWNSDGSALSIIFDPESAENSASIINGWECRAAPFGSLICSDWTN